MDYYEILGVGKDATKDEIKKAFRTKARQYHPDVNKAPDAEEKFKKLGKAYETLSDDSKRELYDRYGEDGLKNAGYTQGPFDFGFGDINDIFSQFFGGFDFGTSGGFSTRGNPNSSRRGDDLRYDIELEFEEAIFGIEKEIKIKHLEPCESCAGSGLDKNVKDITCKTCGGRGQVQQTMKTPLGAFTTVGACPSCHGTGRDPSACCKKCKGSGLVEKEKTLKIKIPKGVDDNSKIRISGEGDMGRNGGRSGDLYLVIHVKPSKIFERLNNDIFSNLQITMPQAVLGDKVIVETLDGKKEISVPKGIKNLEKLCLKGFGVPNLGNSEHRGNHYVTISITTPDKLSSKEEELWRQLFELSKKEKLNDKEGIVEKIKSSFAK
ncbi:MAG: molecular chaperone DnaJ [Cyanobacteria bacterium SIG30]|nr:molecular chaperone DnaJ [Cyanobacteria bacterium SIG30]